MPSEKIGDKIARLGYADKLEDLVKDDKKRKTIEGFRRYKPREEMGEMIYKALLSQRNKGEDFIFGYKDDTPGYLSQLYGGLGLVYLINRYKLNVDDAEHTVQLKKVLDRTFGHLDKHDTFDADPYLEDHVSGKLFAKGRHYTDSVALTLSFLIHCREACNERERKKGQKDKRGREVKKGVELDSAYQEKIKDYIIETMDILNQSVIKIDGKCAGWGYASGCKQPMLYCTYIVLQAFNDFYDYILAEDENGVSFDEKLISECAKKRKYLFRDFKNNCVSWRIR